MTSTAGCICTCARGAPLDGDPGDCKRALYRADLGHCLSQRGILDCAGLCTDLIQVLPCLDASRGRLVLVKHSGREPAVSPMDAATLLSHRGRYPPVLRQLRSHRISSVSCVAEPSSPGTEWRFRDRPDTSGWHQAHMQARATRGGRQSPQRAHSGCVVRLPACLMCRTAGFGVSSLRRGDGAGSTARIYTPRPSYSINH